MINERIRELKTFLQLLTKQKSIKIYKNGNMEIVFRFKPNELTVESNKLKDLEDDLLKKLKAITNFKWKIIQTQKQPAFCYNSYVRLLNISSSSSKDRVKRFLKYFEKNEIGSFIKTSYCEVHLKVVPNSEEDFKNFLFVDDSILHIDH